MWHIFRANPILDMSNAIAQFKCSFTIEAMVEQYFSRMELVSERSTVKLNSNWRQVFSPFFCSLSRSNDIAA